MYELYEFVPYNLYMYKFVFYNLYKKRTNYIIRIGMYEFILVNLYKKIVALYRPPPHPLRQWPFYLYTVE